jgi:hypothetical protein
LLQFDEYINPGQRAESGHTQRENIMKQFFIAAGLLAFVTACASAPAPQATQATHYWESSASGNKYRVDEQHCQREAGAGERLAEFDVSSESFDAYRGCMVSRGYVLREY